MTLMRGAYPTPRHKLAAARPYKPYGAAPDTFLWPWAQLSMWNNDVDGCCVTSEEAFAKSCKTPSGGVFISDTEVKQWASAHGVLNGADLQSVLQDMQSDGFQQDSEKYDDGGFTTVDYSQAAILQAAIFEGPVKIGIAAGQLQKTVEAFGNGNGWFATGYAADTAEDHCVSLCGYGPISWLAQQLGVSVPAGIDGTQPGYALFTWSSVGIIDAPSLANIIGEAWVRNPTTVVAPLNPPAPAPAPVDPLAALIAQVQQYGEQAVADVTAWWKKYVGSV